MAQEWSWTYINLLQYGRIYTAVLKAYWIQYKGHFGHSALEHNMPDLCAIFLAYDITQTDLVNHCSQWLNQYLPVIPDVTLAVPIVELSNIPIKFLHLPTYILYLLQLRC